MTLQREILVVQPLKHTLCMVVGGTILVIGACGPSAPSYGTTDLTGSVRFDGESVKKGNVNFIPVGSGQAAMAPIVDGRYDAKGVPLGKVLVRFSATVETGEVNDEGKLKLKNLVPEKYREGIEIEVASGDTQKDFKLDSPPAPE